MNVAENKTTGIGVIQGEVRQGAGLERVAVIGVTPSWGHSLSVFPLPCQWSLAHLFFM